MKALGIVSEYNPFHNGHKKQINEALAKTNADCLICALSGNFTQRGELSILSKWDRAELAIKNGANLVVEIPTIFVNNNAGIYAKAGVEILENLDASYISFGVETNEFDKLIDLSKFLKENEELIEEEIKGAKTKGLSYPKLRENIIIEKLGDNYIDILNKANNILAIEYLKNIKNSIPIMVPRLDVYHDSLNTNLNIASGSFIRNSFINGHDISPYVPKDTLDKLDVNKVPSKEQLFSELISTISKLSKEELNEIYGLEEGLGNIIYNKFRYWKNLDDALNDLKSKRYTLTRILRSLNNILLGIKKEDVKNALLFTRVLAFDNVGSKYLKEVKNKGINIPVITNLNKEKEDLAKYMDTIKFDIKGTDIYNHILGNDMYLYSEYVMGPKMIEKENNR